MTVEVSATRPIIDPRTGALTQYGRRFFKAVFDAVGGMPQLQDGTAVKMASIAPVSVFPKGGDVAPVGVSGSGGGNVGPIGAGGGVNVGPVGAGGSGSGSVAPVAACCPMAGDVGPV